MIKADEAELRFQRIYIEKTTFQHSQDTVTGVFRGRAVALTALWFCTGTLILSTEATEWGVNEGEPVSAETNREIVIHSGFITSSAIRLAIAAHDRTVAAMQSALPKDAERRP